MNGNVITTMNLQKKLRSDKDLLLKVFLGKQQYIKTEIETVLGFQ